MQGNLILFYGSSLDLTELQPMAQPAKMGGNNTPVLFASHRIECALPFCLKYRSLAPNGSWSLKVEGSEVLIRLDNMEVDYDKGGWLYLIEAQDFSQINEWEWVSHNPVRPMNKWFIDREKFSYLTGGGGIPSSLVKIARTRTLSEEHS